MTVSGSPTATGSAPPTGCATPSPRAGSRERNWTNGSPRRLPHGPSVTCDVSQPIFREPTGVRLTLGLGCWSAVPAGGGGVTAGVDEVVDGGAAVAVPPGDRKLGWFEAGDRNAGDSGAGVDHGVSLGEQRHRRT